MMGGMVRSMMHNPGAWKWGSALVGAGSVLWWDMSDHNERKAIVEKETSDLKSLSSNLSKTWVQRTAATKAITTHAVDGQFSSLSPSR